MGVFVGKVNTLAEKSINVSMTAALPSILETFFTFKSRCFATGAVVID